MLRESTSNIPHAHNDVIILLAQTVADGVVGFHDEGDPPLLVAQHQIVFDVPIYPIEKTGESLEGDAFGEKQRP